MSRQKEKKLPRLLFAAPSSGSGKTVITCGFLEILRRRNLSCVSFKCGPDYIDPMFHQYILGVPGYNLDSFFLSPEQVKSLFVKRAVKANKKNINYAVIEGVMGFYDGIGGNTTHASTYEIARITGTPVILVIDGKKSSLSLAAVVKGFLDYVQDSHICGVILNRTSPAIAEKLKPHFEKLGVRVYGAVPVCSEANWESRHLGLTLPEEQEKLREKIRAWADRLEKYLDIDGLLKLADTAPFIGKAWEITNDETGKTGNHLANTCSPGYKNIRRIAIARDEAFCFYYRDNLSLLKQNGWELLFFSPLHDRHLPGAGISAILLGGGYPEIYAKELSENKAMLEELRTACRHGIKFLAECGGFLYLHEWLEGMDGMVYPMTGLVPAKGFKDDKLSRFGYIRLFDAQGKSTFRGHEFHYWNSTFPGEDWKAVKPLSSRQWNCMVATETMLAGFPHLYYGSNPEWILRYLEGLSHNKKQKRP